jgi:hypothetical protein
VSACRYSNVTEIIRDALSRIIHAQEAIEDGDSGYAHALLVGLEADLVSSLAALQEIEVRR